VVSVAATREVEQAAALDEGSHGDEVGAWADGIAHTPSPHPERIYEIPIRHLHLDRVLCSMVASNAEVSIIYRAISGRLTEPNSSYHRQASVLILPRHFHPEQPRHETSNPYLQLDAAHGPLVMRMRFSKREGLRTPLVVSWTPPYVS